MRKIVLSVHVSLDGFMAGVNGEMDWIQFDDELFDFVGEFTDQADAALYGRVTWQMMESYWPKAGDKPNATKHDLHHSKWYNEVEKIVLSKTIHEQKDKTTFIHGDIFNSILDLKNKPGKNILIFGSPSAAHELMIYNLIDEYWVFINPILLGRGIPLFAKIENRIKLQPLMTKDFPCGVTAMHFSIV